MYSNVRNTRFFILQQPDDDSVGVALVQYLLLPEPVTPSLTVSCELWVEPQKGHVISPPKGLSYLLGTSYDQISHHVSLYGCLSRLTLANIQGYGYVVEHSPNDQMFL